VNCDQFCLDQRDLALNEKVGPLALEVSMFLAVTGNPLHVVTTPLQKVKSNLKHFKAVCDVCVYSFGGKTVGQCWPVANGNYSSVSLAQLLLLQNKNHIAGISVGMFISHLSKDNLHVWLGL